jgi:cellulose synthase/poly-beta-1,6-N-acetylglucosamine synthase-like glycosyltransferase
MPISISLGITAYNEERNIGQLLQRVLEQRLTHVALHEIIVISSGSTDRTEAVVAEYAQLDPRIRLIVQAQREGKASAINLFMQEATQPVLVLSSADLQPDYEAIEALAAPFADPEMGMTGSHPVPVNDPATFMGFAAHLLWGLHHELSMAGGFKAGEMVAFRKVFERIPYHTAVDEASVEPIIRGQGYKVQYVPQAIVYNKGPENRADFLRQRRRIYAGHLEVQEMLGYAVSTMSGGRVLRLFLRHLDWRPKQLLWSAAVVALEVYGRWLGKRDFKQKRNHTVWEIATTTKELNK